MAELVADCPRCGSQKITFDLTQETMVRVKHQWQSWFEAFCVCRHCHQSTVFLLSQTDSRDEAALHEYGLAKQKRVVNQIVRIEGFISIKDKLSVAPPAHLPEPVNAAFHEGAICLAIGCFNAAGTMFRLCVDLATKSLLPAGDVDGLNAKVRRDLGLRLPWLFKAGKLPHVLHELSTCIKEDGNDGAHAGTLGRAEVEDMLDFTKALLVRLFSEPEDLRLANARRDERRAAAKKESAGS